MDNEIPEGFENNGEQDFIENDENYEMVREIEEDDYVKKINVFKRFYYIFFSPFKLAENINARPKFAAPFALLAVMALLAGFGSFLTADLSGDRLSDSEDMSRFQSMMNAARQMQNGGEASTGDKIVSVLRSGISFLAGALAANLLVALLWLILCRALRGEASYKKLYSLFMHVSVITALFTSVTLFFNYYTQSALNPLSLELLLPASMTGSALHTAFGLIGIPQVLAWILTSAGVAEFNGFGIKKAGVMTACMAAGSVIFTTAVTVVSMNYIASLFESL